MRIHSVVRIRSIISVLLLAGLSLFDRVDAAKVCSVVPVTVVNNSNHLVSLRGASGVTKIPAKTTAQVAFQSNNFYTKCGLIEVGLNDQQFQKGLIAANSTAVHIRVQPSGTLEQVGLTETGFNLDKYISFFGMGEV